MNFEPDTPGMKQSAADSIEGVRITIFASRPETVTLAALFEAAADWDCRVAADIKEFRGRLIEGRCEVIVLPAEDVDDDLASDVRRLQPNASIVFAAPSAGIQELTRAMRFGAVDFLQGNLGAEEVERRLGRAAERSVERSRRDQAMRRIAEIGRRIDDDSPAGRGHADEIVHDEQFENSPKDFKADHVAMCSEFKTLLRQELDVEDLLRTALEYLLVKTGPTNAAVFLAGGDGRYGLGAYVNYEHARRTVEPMLQRLCDEACPRIAEEKDLLRFDGVGKFMDECEIDPAVAEDVEMIAVPCCHEGECLAVMYLFRGSESSFTAEVSETIDALRGILASQLATLIRVHNRLEESWPEEPSDEVGEDWDDLAA